MDLKVPTNIKIGSHEYKVLFDEREEDGNFRGSILHKYHEILLNPDIHPQQLRVTFIHEVMHAVAHTYSIVPPEEDVSRLAEGIAELLFNNLGVDLDFSDIPTRKVR